MAVTSSSDCAASARAQTDRNATRCQRGAPLRRSTPRWGPSVSDQERAPAASGRGHSGHRAALQRARVMRGDILRALTASPLGRPVLRKEDRRFLTGGGQYLDDLRLPGMLHAAIVRSQHAHARIVAVDVRAALASPGVVAVLTGADLPECAAAIPPFIPSAGLRAYRHPAIAREVARHAGEAVV